MNAKQISRLLGMSGREFAAMVRRRGFASALEFYIGEERRLLWNWWIIRDQCRSLNPGLTEPEPMPEKVYYKTVRELFNMPIAKLEAIGGFPRMRGQYFVWAEIEEWIENNKQWIWTL